MSEFRLSEETGAEELDDSVAAGQRLNRLAVVAAVFGIASALALVNQLGGLFPPVAILLGLLALWQNQRNPLLSGCRVATLGLCLGVCFGTWTYARSYSRERALVQQAQIFGTHWLELVRDKKVDDAIVMLKDHDRRWASMEMMAPSSQEGQEFMAHHQGMSQNEDTLARKKFLERTPFHEMLADDAQPTFRFDRTEEVTSAHDHDLVTQIFQVTCDVQGTRQSWPLRIKLHRPRAKVSNPVNYWHVANAEVKTGE